MEGKSSNITTPRDFYTNLRPEYFSDSKVEYKVRLPRELLAFELENISKNQKQDQFESLARKLAEKFISPNLIPQVGPTGGGDGKTDSETHPVSESISIKWYVPENGWDNNEYWAFAMSSKEDWRGKLRLDIKSILSTERGYTKIFFITSRSISSKKKADAQDSFSSEFGIQVKIIDAEWIIEKILSNDLIDLVVNTLSMSDVYKVKESIKGDNDRQREERIKELEANISNTNRYFETDFQLVEDCLESAILSRGLEHSRDIIDGKFQRTLRLAKKLNNERQLCRIYYDYAWTLIFWFNDFELFVENFNNVKKYIDVDSNMESIKLYYTLVTVLKSHIEVTEIIDVKAEIQELYTLLKTKSENKQHKTTSLIANSFYNLSLIQDNIYEDENCETQFKVLNEIIEESESHLDYPFESIHQSILVFGKMFPESKEYDKLIEQLIKISEKRNSELVSAKLYLKRAFEKFDAGLYKDSISFLGRTVVKLSKKESETTLIVCLKLLSLSYRNIGLLWASNNCLVFAASMSLKSWFSKGYLNKNTYRIAMELAKNEVLLGRMPSLFSVCELLNVLSDQLDITKEEEGIENTLSFLDLAIANRFLNLDTESKELGHLPDILLSLNLEFSSDSALYILGHVDAVIESYNKEDFTEEKMKDWLSGVKSQPIKEQLVYETNFSNNEVVTFESTILGTIVKISFPKNKDLFFTAESILAYLESFFSTSFDEVIPTTEKIEIGLIENSEIEVINLIDNDQSNKFSIEINTTNVFGIENRDSLSDSFIKFTSVIITKNFMIPNPSTVFETLFKEEEVISRTSLAFNHILFSRDFYGENPKVLLEDWFDKKKYKSYENIRISPLDLEERNFDRDGSTDEGIDFKNTPHNKRKVNSIIDTHLWDNARWLAFGFILEDASTMALTILFDDFEYGKKIFDGWKKDIGDDDTNDEIRISIIRGINKNNPHWYRVHITKNFDFTNVTEDGIYTVASRFHELNATNSHNLNGIITNYKKLKKYNLYPSRLVNGRIEPDFTRGIKKRLLIIKHAWEISLGDLDSMVIKDDDEVVIPDNIKNPPIIKLLEAKKNNNGYSFKKDE